MGKVDEEDETDENKDGCSKRCDPVAPKDEEAVRDEPGNENEEQPGGNFGAPPPVHECQ